MMYLIRRASDYTTEQCQSPHPRAIMLTDDDFDTYNLDKASFYDYFDEKQLYPFMIEINEQFANTVASMERELSYMLRGLEA